MRSSSPAFALFLEALDKHFPTVQLTASPVLLRCNAGKSRVLGPSGQVRRSSLGCYKEASPSLKNISGLLLLGRRIQPTYSNSLRRLGWLEMLMQCQQGAGSSYQALIKAPSCDYQPANTIEASLAKRKVCRGRSPHVCAMQQQWLLHKMSSAAPKCVRPTHITHLVDLRLSSACRPTTLPMRI